MRAAARGAMAGLLLLAVSAAAAVAENPFPGLAAAYLVKVQDRTVWAGGAARRLPPASLTKIMTALLVLETGRPDDVVTVSRAAGRETGTRLGLRAGERLTVTDLLTAALVRSANDACRALADWRAGGEARFVRLMNRRAAALGLRETRFANACGHDAPDHYASARDLAALAEIAMRRPDFAGLVALPEARVRTLDGGREFAFENTNALLGRLPGAIGVKTGYTPRAGPSVVALAERAGGARPPRPAECAQSLVGCPHAHRARLCAGRGAAWHVTSGGRRRSCSARSPWPT